MASNIEALTKVKPVCSEALHPGVQVQLVTPEL